MTGEVKIPRAIPHGLAATLDDLGYEAVPDALKAMTQPWRDGEFNLTNMNFAIFGPPGSGKSAVAAVLHKQLQTKCPWLTSLRAPWVAATWIGMNAQPGMIDEASGEGVIEQLIEARLLTIDGLGEEADKQRERLHFIIKGRMDAGRPTIITSRLALDGPGSLAVFHPHVRRALEKRFVYVS